MINMTELRSNHLAISELTDEPIGCLIEIDDPAAIGELDDTDDRLLNDAFAEHFLILMRGLDLTYDQQVRLAQRIGPVLHRPERNMVSNVLADGILGNSELEWHSDVLFTKIPYLGISLFGLDVVPRSSSTCFASGPAALRRLPDAERARLANLKALSLGHGFNDIRDYDEAVARNAPRAIHPLIFKHPRTGVDTLLADSHTVRVLDVDAATSEEILALISAYFYAPENIFEHWWEPGDLLIWDNLLLQHARGPLDPSVPRTLQRVLLGEARLEDQLPDYTFVR
jgi:taurine dioxygenase